MGWMGSQKGVVVQVVQRDVGCALATGHAEEVRHAEGVLWNMAHDNMGNTVRVIRDMGIAKKMAG